MKEGCKEEYIFHGTYIPFLVWIRSLKCFRLYVKVLQTLGLWKCNLNISRRRSQGIVSGSYNWTPFPVDKRCYRSLNLYSTILTFNPPLKKKKINK